MKKKAKTVTGEQGPVKSNPARHKATKALKAKPAKGEATDGSASKAALGETAPPAALAKPEVNKIQGLLKSKTADGVTLGLSLLESLNATQADYEAVFTERVNKAVSRIVNDWLQGGDATRAEYVRYHTAVVRPVFLAAWGPATEPAKPFLDLVDIPAGSFTMGSPENEADRKADESQVQVRITKPFRLGRTVVTQRQWREVMGTEPWRYERLMKKNQCGDDFPAVCVSWDDAVLFCQTLTDLERETGRLAATQSYRLPTEAEWEYACRAGTTTAYSFGDDPNLLGDYGWYEGNAGRRLHRVAEKKPNSWGLYDMNGNVREWCADWYDATLAGGDDPIGPPGGSGRVIRGGNWCFIRSGGRSANRSKYHPQSRIYNLYSVIFGFRVAV